MIPYRFSSIVSRKTFNYIFIFYFPFLIVKLVIILEVLRFFCLTITLQKKLLLERVKGGH